MEGGSKGSYSSQVHDLFPHAQPTVYVYPPPPAPPPPKNPQGQGQGQQQGYQSYLGEEDPLSYGSSSYYGWPEHHPAPAAAARSHHQEGPFQQRGYLQEEDADCITFLRGCFAGLCCCCLLEQCCCV